MADQNLWQKVLAAKQEAEADYPMESHQASWEERDMHIFANMVKAATGQWSPKSNTDKAKTDEATADEEPPSAPAEDLSLLEIPAKVKPAPAAKLKE